MLTRRTEPGSDQQGAELVAVQADRVRLLIQAGTADMSGRGMVEQLFLNRVPVEPGDGAQPASDGGPGPAADLQVTGEALDVGAPGLEQAQVVLGALRRPRDYADLAAGAAGGGRGRAGKVGIIRPC